VGIDVKRKGLKDFFDVDGSDVEVCAAGTVEGAPVAAAGDSFSAVVAYPAGAGEGCGATGASEACFDSVAALLDVALFCVEPPDPAPFGEVSPPVQPARTADAASAVHRSRVAIRGRDREELFVIVFPFCCVMVSQFSVRSRCESVCDAEASRPTGRSTS
jgi:hypothetical protein